MADWILRWRRKSIDGTLQERLLDKVWASDFGRISRGDRLWICGHPKGDIQSLSVIGYLDVDELRRSAPGDGGEETVVAMQPYVEPAEVRLLRDDLLALRFNGTPDRFDLDAKLPPQLGRRRELTPDSAQRLLNLWMTGRGKQPSSDDVAGQLDALLSLDVERRTKQRAEQQKIRQLLLRGKTEGHCSICGGLFPARFLIASHIKPRAECSDDERRDINNVVLMCSFGCDALFEEGDLWVDVSTVVMEESSELYERLVAFRRKLAGKPARGWSVARAPYFQWHADRASH